MIKHIASKDLGKGVPYRVTGVNGWQIQFRSSKSDPEQGTQTNIGWIDEEIENPQHFNELIRGFMRFGGRGIWSATPLAANLQLLKLRRRAEQGDPNVLAIPLYLDNNPYILSEEKKEFYDSLPEDQKAVRYHGIPAIYSKLIYWMYSPNKDARDGGHGCERFELPEDWPIYVGVDPATRHCGTVIGTVDPEERHLWIRESFDIMAGDANRWAAELAHRLAGRRPQAIVMDQKMGKQSPPKEELGTVAESYQAALNGLSTPLVPYHAGPMAGFFEGLADVSAREERLLAMLHVRRDGPFAGTPKLQVIRGKNTTLDSQIQGAQMKEGRRKKKGMIEDILHALEYLAAFNPCYEKPPIPKPDDGEAVYEAFMRKQRRQRRDRTELPGLVIGS